jgi:hypothetical protein
MLFPKLAAAAVATVLGAASCHATAFYVSASGSGSTCTIAQPCLYLSTAIGAAGIGDSIICLSAPQPSNLTITKSITIDCSGARGELRDNSAYGALGSGTRPAVVISITPSSADPLRTVRLSGLTVDGENVSSAVGRWLDIGIEIDAAATVYVEDCVISNVKSQGILDRRSGGQTLLFVKNTVVSGNGGPGIVASSGAPGVMVLDNVSLLNNLYGLAAASGNNVFVNNSVISGNAQAGVEADGGAQVTVDSSKITNNNIGVLVGGTVRLLNSNVSFNNQAVSGSAISLGRNTFSGNSAIGSTPPLASGASGDVYN